MSERYVMLIALVLTTAGLAGCLAGDGGGDDRSTSAGDLDSQSQPGMSTTGGNLTSLTFPVDEATDRTVWANGTFGPQESCYAGGCPTGSAFRQVELDDEIPDGVPTTVRAQLTYETGPTIFAQPLDLGVFSEDASFYAFESDGEQGRDEIRTTVLQEGPPIIVQVFYNWPTGAEPEASYTLRIDIEADTTVLPSGVPVEVPAEPGQRITAEAVAGAGTGSDAASPTLVVYGPDDTLFTRWSSEGGQLDERLPPDAPSGGYVLVAPEDGPALRLKTNGSDAEMRPLTLTFDGGDPHPVRGPEPVSWSFDASTVPLGVGVYLTDEQPLGASVDEGSVTLEGPSETLIDSELGCGTCITGGFGTGTSTPLGDPGLATGTYSVTYEPTAEAGYAVGHFVIGYER